MSYNPSSRGAAVRDYGKSVDFGQTTDDYARFRPGPPPALYDRISSFISLPGRRAVDVGTGTGLVAIELAARGAIVTGIDPSEPQLDAARHAAHAGGIPSECDPDPGPSPTVRGSVTFLRATAESTTLHDNAFDLYIASQSWHWFNPHQAAAEALRILRPGGLAMTVSFDYLPRRSTIASATEDLILRHNPTWPMAGGHGAHINPMYDLPNAGFELVEQVSWEHLQPFTHEAWRGRMRTCNGVGGSLTPDKVAAFDADLLDLLTREHPQEPALVHHRVWLVVARKPR